MSAPTLTRRGALAGGDRLSALEDEINIPVLELTNDACDARIDSLADGQSETAGATTDTPAATIHGILLNLGVSLR
jgi:hypothetical protein